MKEMAWFFVYVNVNKQIHTIMFLGFLITIGALLTASAIIFVAGYISIAIITFAEDLVYKIRK